MLSYEPGFYPWIWRHLWKVYWIILSTLGTIYLSRPIHFNETILFCMYKKPHLLHYQSYFITSHMYFFSSNLVKNFSLGPIWHTRTKWPPWLTEPVRSRGSTGSRCPPHVWGSSHWATPPLGSPFSSAEHPSPVCQGVGERPKKQK